ncbi:MAG: methyl-accepting chemotaxis protein [Victivallales bacterium]|nr:methyl-accepting chemotaxis protein [Victivallales bacterium]
MFGLFTKTLKRRLISIFIAIAVIPIIIIAYFSIKESREALIKEELNKLNAIRVIKTNQLLTFFKDLEKGIKVFSQSRELHIILEELLSKHQVEIHKAKPGEVKYDKNIRKEAAKCIQNYMKIYDRPDIIAFCDAGHFLYSHEHPEYFNKEVMDKKDSNLAKAFKLAKESGKLAIVGFAKDPYYDDRVTMYLSIPIFDENNKLEFVLAVQIVPKTIDEIMNERTGLGKTGETYLVGEDFLMRSDSRFDLNGKDSILNRRVKTVAVIESLRDKEGFGIIEDYRGKDVFSSYGAFHFDELKGIVSDVKNWAVISEIDAEEAFAPVNQLIYNIIIASSIIIISVIILGLIFSNSISKPIISLASKANSIAKDKDLTIDIPIRKTKDEISSLLVSFREMIESLKNQILEMASGSTQLSASINEISATSTQLASSTAESSTSVTEISTTVEQIKQISESTSEKATEISEKARKTEEIASEGREATEKTIEGINKIDKEMNYIAQSTIKLGEQTQNIGEIIDSVNNLADQTNLLSVNASIEAAKAGEYGKGFAVVAKEVKDLAEQSREATKQISNILNDIQKASSNAVLATERGSNAVKEGLDLSSVARKTINTLSESISEAAEANEQISSSSKQELSGMEQLVQTMENIKEGLTQNTEGSKQLEELANSLTDLSQKLQDMANAYNVGQEDKKHSLLDEDKIKKYEEEHRDDTETTAKTKKEKENRKKN